MTVRYFNIIRDLAGRKEEPLELPDDATVAMLLQVVAGLHGEPMRKLLLTSDGTKSPYLSLFVNEKRVQGAELAAQIADGAIVMLLPAIAGGCR